MSNNGTGNDGDGKIQANLEQPDRDQINYAHDLLSMIADDAQLLHALEVEGDDFVIILASRNVLCWILGHGNTSFPDGMKILEDAMKELGQDMLRPH